MDHPGEKELTELREATKTIERITAIGDEEWAAVADEVMEKYNEALTRAGIAVTKFKERWGFMPS